mmetsp:Transcript_83006/g.231674  ORF Transcript_83006/g.231674 Transcript_83006/m.231674 type:complete len:206 (+) Transcript_83006:1592-2209(+)
MVVGDVPEDVDLPDQLHLPPEAQGVRRRARYGHQGLGRQASELARLLGIILNNVPEGQGSVAQVLLSEALTSVQLPPLPVRAPSHGDSTAQDDDEAEATDVAVVNLRLRRKVPNDELVRERRGVQTNVVNLEESPQREDHHIEPHHVGEAFPQHLPQLVDVDRVYLRGLERQDRGAAGFPIEVGQLPEVITWFQRADLTPVDLHR